jgi:hypothetical protein
MFDKVASIGLRSISASTIIRSITRRCSVLKPDGLFLHPFITRPAKRDGHGFRCKRPEFALLTKPSFPAANSTTSAYGRRDGAQRAKVHDVEGWRELQRTCKQWHDRLLANHDAAVRSIMKTRMWLVYLAACSIAFERNTVGLYQTLASKRRGPSGLPPTGPTFIAHELRGWRAAGRWYWCAFIPSIRAIEWLLLRPPQAGGDQTESIIGERVPRRHMAAVRAPHLVVPHQAAEEKTEIASAIFAGPVNLRAVINPLSTAGPMPSGDRRWRGPGSRSGNSCRASPAVAGEQEIRWPVSGISAVAASSPCRAPGRQ